MRQGDEISFGSQDHEQMAFFDRLNRISLTLEQRLKLSIAIILLVIVGLACVWSVRDAKEDVRQEAEASLHLALTLIDAAHLSGHPEPSVVHAWINEIRGLAPIRHLHITASASDESAPLSGEDEGAFHASGVPFWFERAVLAVPIRVTRDLSLGDGSKLKITIESRADDEIREAWIQTRGFMILLAVFAVSVYFSVHLIAGRALRPVNRIIQGLHQIEKGNYETSLQKTELPELQRIVEGINHLALTLTDVRNENRALTRHSLNIQEEERQTLAQEMHDEVGQNLTAIKMMSGLITESPEKREQAANEIQRVCDRLFEVVRSIIHRLRPMVLEDLGLKAALDDLVDHWRLIDPAIHISIHCHESIGRLNGDSALEIYRIVQEALTNIVRHSGGNRAEVRIQPTDPCHLLLRVTDNGKGLNLDMTRRGFGLLGMRERVASLEGDFDLISREGQGLEIRIVLPIEEGHNG